MDGRSYSGVVLSDGLLLTAVEIDLMEVVPELVFLNCCHLGSVNNPHSQPNKLAYSLSRKLIEMGVRCVVAAGWAVNDAAACTFASTFFDQLTQGETFGDAIFSARQCTFQQHPASNTWGAYQAYGDPGYRWHRSNDSGAGHKSHAYVAVDELLAAILGQRVKNRRRQSASGTPSFAQHQQWLQRQLAKCPPAWAELPDVLQACAEFYGDYGVEGFDLARAAYQRAVQEEDRSGRVALRAIEQLANMEARHAGNLAEHAQFDQALSLIGSAIDRLKALADAVRSEAVTTVPASNGERAAMLGSALKLKAATLLLMGKTWNEVSPCLQDAAKAYGSAVHGDPTRSPYHTLNALALGWLTDSPEPGREQAVNIARQCGETARQRFTTSKNFWDAVLSVDAQMTAWLLGGPLEDTDAGTAASKTPALILQQRYEQALESLPSSAREWDSLLRQWRMLVNFMRLSRKQEATSLAETLTSVADHFAPRLGDRPDSSRR